MDGPITGSVTIALAPADARAGKPWLPLAVAVAAAATFGVSVAAANTLGHSGARAAATPFGGTTAVAVPRAGRIDRALGPAGAGRLLRVRCAGAGGTACFTALP